VENIVDGLRLQNEIIWKILWKGEDCRMRYCGTYCGVVKTAE
jgi:hypothetical protein